MFTLGIMARLPVTRDQILKLLAQRIRSLRTAKGWTQEEFAELAAIQRSYLADLELGRRNPSVRTLVRVASAFGTAAQELLEGGVEKRPSKESLHTR
jgi:transcriptional regulator with XRE-family HTH domain